MVAFRDGIEHAQHAWFDRRYGDRQLILAQLATHPDYWRIGLGGDLVEWGKKVARRHKLAIVLFASPMGQNLYTKLGFQIFDSVQIEANGELVLSFPGMTWE